MEHDILMKCLLFDTFTDSFKGFTTPCKQEWIDGNMDSLWLGKNSNGKKINVVRGCTNQDSTIDVIAFVGEGIEIMQSWHCQDSSKFCSIESPRQVMINLCSKMGESYNQDNQDNQ